METLIKIITTGHATVAALPPDLIMLGLIGLVIIGAFVTPWIGTALRLTRRALPYVAKRLCTMAIEKLINWLLLALLALLGGIAWLADLTEFVTAILKH